MNGCIMKNTVPRPFEIYGASALSLHKNTDFHLNKFLMYLMIPIFMKFMIVIILMQHRIDALA